MMRRGLLREPDLSFRARRAGCVMRMDTGRNRVVATACLAALFAVLAVSLVVPFVMVAVMGLVDRLLMHLWYGVVADLGPKLAARWMPQAVMSEETAA